MTSLRFEVVANSGRGARLGLIVPRRFGSAVARNLFKRRVREVFRELRSGLPDVDLVVMPRGTGLPGDIEAIRRDFERCAARLA